MAWSNKTLLVFSLTFLRYAQAVNPCASGLLSCFAVEIQPNIYDYELVYDQIPDNSLSSICNKLYSTFPKAKLGRPGCITSSRGPGFSSLLAFSSRRPGSDTATGFNDMDSTFSSALECDSQRLASCQVMNASASNIQTVWMSQPGNSFYFADDITLTLANITPSNTLIKFVDSTSNIANATQMISTQLGKLNRDVTGLVIYSLPISHAVSLVVTVDMGLSPSFAGKNSAIRSGGWLVLLQGLVTAGIGSNTGSIAGTYSMSTSSTSPGLYISVSIDQ